MFISEGSTSNNGGVPFLLKTDTTFKVVLIINQNFKTAFKFHFCSDLQINKQCVK